MDPRTKTKPFPGEENLPSELLDTAPGRPALLKGEHDLSTAEPPVPDGYFDELLDAAKATPALPERPDSAGAKNARFSGRAGVPQRARDQTLPTGEVLVEPVPLAEARAHALATANPSREVDLEAFVRDAEVRRAVTVPALRVREAEEQRVRRHRGLVGLASGALVAALLASAIYVFVNRNNRLTPVEPAAASASTPGLTSVVVPPAVAPSPPPSPSPSALTSAAAPSAAPTVAVAAPTIAVASPPRPAAPPVSAAPPASAAAPVPPPPPPRASVDPAPTPTSSKMRPF